MKKEESPATPTTPAAGHEVQLQDLQSILRNMNPAAAAAAPTGAAVRTPCDIAEAMKPENIIPMLANEKIRESLIKFLPESTVIPKTEAELRETIHSPQFQQACSGKRNCDLKRPVNFSDFVAPCLNI